MGFNPVEYSGVEGDGQLMVCVEILTTAESSEYDVIVDLKSVDGAKAGTHCIHACTCTSNHTV